MKDKAEGGKIETLVGKDTKFNGTLKVNGAVRIDGYLEGKVESKDSVVLGKEGKIKGDIKTKDVIVGGRVIGNIYASNRAEFQHGANFQGELFCKQLVIAEGVFFEGSCRMSEQKDEQKSEQKAEPPKKD
jgi:cytoskeletal protein CcmA (bactofilin family)